MAVKVDSVWQAYAFLEKQPRWAKLEESQGMLSNNIPFYEHICCKPMTCKTIFQHLMHLSFLLRITSFMQLAFDHFN